MFDIREEYEKQAQEAIDGFEDTKITITDREKTTDWLLSHIDILRGMNENNIHEEVTYNKIKTMVQKYDFT